MKTTNETTNERIFKLIVWVHPVYIYKKTFVQDTENNLG